jgi:hypothetical protein
MKKLNLILALMLLISGGLLGCGSAEQDAVEQVPVEASTSDNTESRTKKRLMKNQHLLNCLSLMWLHRFFLYMSLRESLAAILFR